MTVERKHANKKVILFNGPPHCGKDTAVGIAKNFLNGNFAVGGLIPYRPIHFKFADPLKAAAHALYGIPYSCEYYEKEFGNGWKDAPQVEFFGATPRSEYIALSEQYAKSRHGVTVFGRVAARRVALEKQANVFLFSDSGFAVEASPIVSLVGKNNVFVVELSRPGSDFSNDSRSYIGEELNRLVGDGIEVLRIPNSGDKEDLRLLIQGAMCKWLKVPM